VASFNGYHPGETAPQLLGRSILSRSGAASRSGCGANPNRTADLAPEAWKNRYICDDSLEPTCDRRDLHDRSNAVDFPGGRPERATLRELLPIHHKYLAAQSQIDWVAQEGRAQTAR
jgi:hypothetical protein